MPKPRASRTRTLVALLRAVNVGGTGTLAMRDLAALCERLGFTDVRTYIQSGNVVLRTGVAPAKVRHAVERALAAHMGAPVDVFIRTAPDMRAIVNGNPFPTAEGNRVYVFFSSQPLDAALFAMLRGPNDERAVARTHEVYVHYPIGMGASKLKLPKFPGPVTARNMNTVAKLVAMCDE